ncbi:MAG: hypothetical protein AAGK04_09175 [Planctomycetota bacterium]
MRRWVSVWSSVLLALVVVSPVCAQDDQATVSTPEEFYEDFVHFVKVAKNEQATLLGENLLASGLTPEEFVAMVEDSDRARDFDEAVDLASRRPDAPELNEVAQELRRLFERGRLNIARNPDQIARSIELLTGNRRGLRLATERLVFAGEYAMPQLLEALLQSEDRVLRQRASDVIKDLKRQAIAPLTAALPLLDPARQELVIDVLGDIEYRGSIPTLRDLESTTGSASVREAARNAIARVDPSASGRSPADLYRDLSEAFLDERQELTSFPDEEFQLLWTFDPGLSLIPTPIRTEVYHEAMAMRNAERAIELGSTDGESLALWVAANYSREIDAPSGYDNPAWPADRRDATYFGVASGVEVGQRVLARAIADRDTPLARRAIAALERTAGAGQLWSRLGGSRPLLDALLYPSRRVQYEAALALGRAQPTESFDGAERVVPMLASAVRDATASYAAVFTADPERYQSMRARLEGLGYEVLPQANNPREISGALAEIAAVDLVVVSLSADRARSLVNQLHSDPRLTAAPTLLMLSSDGYVRLRRTYDRDATVAVRPLGLTESQFRATLGTLMNDAAGGRIDERDARDYRRRALETLRDIAVARGTAYNIEDAALPLIGAMAGASGPVKLSIGEVLARVGTTQAQVALLDNALAEPAGSIERIELLHRVADSAKRYGRLVSDQQVERLITAAVEETGPAATSAAAAVGAMNLQNDRLLRLITQN